MPRVNFHPDVTLGELKMLAKMGALTRPNAPKISSPKLLQELNATKDRVDTALQHIEAAYGTVQVQGGGARGSRRVSSKGRNIGGAAVLADLLIEIACDANTSQHLLMLSLIDLIALVRGRYTGGDFVTREDADF